MLEIEVKSRAALVNNHNQSQRARLKGCPNYRTHYTIPELTETMEKLVEHATRMMKVAERSVIWQQKTQQTELKDEQVQLPYLRDKTLLGWVEQTTVFMYHFDAVNKAVMAGNEQITVPGPGALRVKRERDAEGNSDPRVRVPMLLSININGPSMYQYLLPSYEFEALYPRSYSGPVIPECEGSAPQDTLLDCRAKWLFKDLSEGFVRILFEKFECVDGTSSCKPKSLWDTLQEQLDPTCRRVGSKLGLATCAKEAVNVCQTMAQYLDASILVTYRAWSKAISRNSHRAAEWVREAQDFFVNHVFPSYEPYLTELSKPGGFCATYIHDSKTQNPFHVDKAEGPCRWHREILAAALNMLATLPDRVEKERELEAARMREAAAQFALKVAERNAEVVGFVGNVTMEKVFHTPEDAEYAFLRTKSIGRGARATELRDVERAELAELLQRLDTWDKLSALCGELSGGCLTITGKRLNLKEEAKAVLAVGDDDNALIFQRDAGSGWRNWLQRRHGLWKDCGGSRIVFFAHEGFLEARPSKSGQAAAAMRYVPYANILSSSLALYTKSTGESKNRVYLAFHPSQSGLEMPDSMSDTELVFEVDSQSAQRKNHLEGQVLFHTAGAPFWQAETARNAAMFLTAKAHWCREVLL